MLYWIFPVVFPPTEWPRWLFSVYRSFLCVTSKTPQCQKSHVSSYLIHVLWCMFFCPPLSGVCSSYTAVNELLFFCLSPPSLVTFLFSVLLFMCGPPSRVFSWSRTLQRQVQTDPLLLCSPSLPAHPPLFLFTHRQIKGLHWPPASEILQNYPTDVSPGVSVCASVYTQMRTSQLKEQFSFLL